MLQSSQRHVPNIFPSLSPSPKGHGEFVVVIEACYTEALHMRQAQEYTPVHRTATAVPWHNKQQGTMLQEPQQLTDTTKG